MKPVSSLVIISFLMTTFHFTYSQNNKESHTPTKWYTYTQPGELMYFTAYSDRMVVERISEHDKYAEPKLRTVKIVKQIDENHYVIENKKKDGFGLLKKVFSSNGQVLDVNYPVEGKTIKSIEEQFSRGVPIWKSLEGIRFYTKEKFKEIKSLPGLDKISREDLIASLEWRKLIGGKLEAYLEDSDGSKPFQIYRFLEAYRNKRLIELGYNPYKMVAYNFEKQFAGDDEVIKLLTEEITFD